MAVCKCEITVGVIFNSFRLSIYGISVFVRTRLLLEYEAELAALKCSAGE
jgi:hypothetical protein